MTTQTDTREKGNLKRELHPIPADIDTALRERGVLDAYRRRPAYQQNDYIGWIGQARRPDTRQKRLNQMLDELEEGGVYMKMEWNGD